MSVTLEEIDEADLAGVLAVELGPGQERFVTTVADSLEEARRHPEGKPWCRAVHADGRPVGFVMLSWDLDPLPPDMNGPWFLWKLIVHHREQGRGYGREVVQQVLDIVHAQGGTELLTSHVVGDGGPAGFYAKLGFVPRGDLDPDGEVILRRPVP